MRSAFYSTVYCWLHSCKGYYDNNTHMFRCVRACVRALVTMMLQPSGCRRAWMDAECPHWDISQSAPRKLQYPRWVGSPTVSAVIGGNYPFYQARLKLNHNYFMKWVKYTTYIIILAFIQYDDSKIVVRAEVVYKHTTWQAAKNAIAALCGCNGCEPVKVTPQVINGLPVSTNR